MKRVVWLLCGLLGLGCSAAEPDGVGAGGAPAQAGNAALGGGGGANVTGGASSIGGAAAGSSTAGSVAGGAAGAAGAANAGSGPGGGSGTAGNAGSSSGGAGMGGGSGCVPEPAGSPSVVGETVHDAKTCLDWMKTTQTGVNYEAAEQFCATSTLGGFDDWRIPDVHEYASIVTLCGKYPPEGPVDTKLFDQQGDGYWTRTPAGEPNKVCAVGMANAGGYYHYGTAGPQVVRCVRGTGSVKTIKDCTVAQGCSSW